MRSQFPLLLGLLFLKELAEKYPEFFKFFVKADPPIPVDCSNNCTMSDTQFIVGLILVGTFMCLAGTVVFGAALYGCIKGFRARNAENAAIAEGQPTGYSAFQA